MSGTTKAKSQFWGGDVNRQTVHYQVSKIKIRVPRFAKVNESIAKESFDNYH